ncbi:signal peptidase II [Candidatus Gracilibacteria bacterium 28_42_T64]|nr:signal peptidase II [Candidatus Gracilibacteria bacterium 28_42_T64]
MFYIILIPGIILDFITKNLANTYLQNKISILGDFFYLQYAENTGIAFSIQIPSFFLKTLTLTLIIAIFYYYKTEKKKISPQKKQNLLLDISFGLILAGAIGNAIGRIFHSYVIDFIGIQYFSIFNMADIYINLGALLYIYLLIKNRNL